MVHGNIIKRGMWKMAKVVDLIPGKDGVVQGAKVCGNVKVSMMLKVDQCRNCEQTPTALDCS